MDHSWGHPQATRNNRRRLSHNTGHKGPWLLNISREMRIVRSMKHSLKIMTLAMALACASPVFAADCYADYKAKQDSPLRLHYGVLEITGACNAGSAQQEARQRLSAQGWTLLNILSVFGPDGLQQRKDSAGQYYLRF